MSVSFVDKLSVGNKRMHVMSFNASAAEENIVTGLQTVDHFSVGPKSITTGAYYMFNNVNSTAAVANGTIGVSGLVAGDEMFIYAYGK